MGKNRMPAAPQPLPHGPNEITAVLHQGPLPHPEEFRRYDEALPGAADRILVMAEREQASRLDATRRTQEQQFALQCSALRASTLARLLGQVIGAGVIGGTLWVARDLLMSDRSIAGMSALIAALAALAGLFVYRRQQRS